MTPEPKNRQADELVEYLTRELTLSTQSVADWHYLELALNVDRNKPLVRLLVDLVAPQQASVVDLREPMGGAMHGPVLLAV